MLTKLEPYDIADFWPAARRGLKSMYGELNNADRILNLLLDGKLQCWLIIDDSDNDISILGFVITQVINQEVEDRRVLVLRDLFSLNGFSKAVGASIVGTLEKFGKASGCKEIIAFTNNKIVENKAKKFGFEVSSIMRKEI